MSRRPLTPIPARRASKLAFEGLNPDIWDEQDYAVVDGETLVGGIYLETIQGESGFGSCTQNRRRRQTTATLEEAKAGFKVRYQQVKAAREPRE